MTVTLRPMSLGEILDRTFQIYRSRFLVFVGIAAGPAVAMMVVGVGESAWLSGHPMKGPVVVFSMSLTSMLWTLSLSMLAGFFQLLVRPAFVSATAVSIANVPASLRGSFAVVRRFWRSILALNLFEQAVVILAPGGVFILCSVGVLMAGGAPGTVLRGLLALLLVGVAGVLVAVYIWLGTSLAFSFQALAVEQVGWFAAVRRSWSLTKGSKGRIVAIFCVLYLVSRIGSALLRWTVYFCLRGLPSSLWMHLPVYFVSLSVARGLMGLLIGPIYPIALTLIYYDQRIRREGYDIEWMMSAAGMNAPGALRAGATEETSVTALAPAAVGPASSEGPTA